MRVAVVYEYSVQKKQALGQLVRTVLAAFDAAGATPAIGVLFSDSPLGDSTRVIDRAVKRFPELQPMATSTAAMPGLPVRAVLSNIDAGGDVRADLPLARETLLAIADGVPRSFPFHTAAIHFRDPSFGDAGVPTIPTAPALGVKSGIRLTDDWWVNGRSRSCAAIVILEAEDAARALPAPPGPAGSVVAALGKPKKTSQMVIPGLSPAAAVPAAASDVTAIVAEYRKSMLQMMERLNLPHDLPPLLEVLGTVEPSGPLKPTLVAAFKPRGYDCKGGSGTFSLTRRTTSNLTVELALDVGTWSRMVTPIYHVSGPGFQATLPLRVSLRAADAMQYPIGGPDRWRQIVENLAAIVDELDRSFVPRIEAAAGPAPAWFEPGRST
jgi:hypothetical protein